MHVIEQIGAIAGLGAFFGLAVLAFIYFAQARHVRDLEEKATFVPEDLDLPSTAPEPVAATARKAVEDDQDTEEGAAAATSAPPRPPQSEAEAARQIEIARARAERRARFEQRRRSPGAADGAGPEPRRMPEPRAMAVIGLGVVVLVIGVVFGAGRLLGGDEDSGSSSNSSAAAEGESTGPPTEVAVLNGTPVPGLAAKIGQQARDANFKLGAVTNTDTPFTETIVMFDLSADKEAEVDAKDVAVKLQISKVEPMSPDVKKVANGASVAVVVGEDRAGT